MMTILYSGKNFTRMEKHLLEEDMLTKHATERRNWQKIIASKDCIHIEEYGKEGEELEKLETQIGHQLG
jgi:hypothetical protein